MPITKVKQEIERIWPHYNPDMSIKAVYIYVKYAFQDDADGSEVPAPSKEVDIWPLLTAPQKTAMTTVLTKLRALALAA